MENPRVVLRQSIVPYIRRRAFYYEIGAFVIALLFGRIEIFAGLLPFGVAFLAAMDMSGRNVYYPMAGAVAGAALTLPDSLPAVAGCCMYVLLRSGYQMFRKKLKRVDKLLLLAVGELLLLPVFYLQTIADFLQGMAGFALVMLLCIAFQNGLRALQGLSAQKSLQEEEKVALCLLFGSFSLAVSDISAYAFSFGIVCIVWAAVFLSYSRGLAAVAAAVALAGMLVLGTKAHPLLLADMAACTLASVLCRRTGGTWGAPLGFLVCCAITEQYFGLPGQHIGLLNALPAALGVALMPTKVMLTLRAAVDSSAREERTARAVLKRMQSRTVENIRETAQTVDRMAELFPPAVDLPYAQTLEQQEIRDAVQHICADCQHRGACWKNHTEMAVAIERLLPAYNLGMRPRPEAPIHSECARTISLAAAATSAKQSYRKQCALLYKQQEQKAFTHRQLQGIGRAMESLSEEIATHDWPDEGFSQIVFRRLEREGLPVRGVMAQKNKQCLRVELKLPPEELDETALEEALSRAAGRRMRLLLKQKREKHCHYSFEQAQRLKAVSGNATRAMPGSNASGDSAGMVNLPYGYALFALSDGMGTGNAARAKSKEAIHLLFKLYQMGFERDAALECVNRLLIGQDEYDMYATLDALHVDLETGAAEFIKFGASPSFVLREGKVYTVYAEALPAGILDEAAPAIHTATLRCNDVAVLLTDGVLDALGEDTTEEILRCVGGANTCAEAATELLQAANARSVQDDMTVLVVRIE